MSREDIKIELDKVLDQFSNNALEELLTFLKTVKGGKTPGQFQEDLLEKIITEDRELLKRLAQ